MAMEVGGTVRTSNQSLTDGQKKPLALDASGNLKVSVGGTVTTSGTTTSTPTASELHIGEVGSPIVLKDVTPTLDTSAYAAGDTLFATTAIANAVRVNDGLGVLTSLQVIDKGDQGAAIDFYFFSSNVTFGSANAAPSISDADAASLLAIVSVATTDYKDLGGVKVASIKAINSVLKGVSGGSTIYVAATTSGSPTYAASDIVLRVGVLQG